MILRFIFIFVFSGYSVSITAQSFQINELEFSGLDKTKESFLRRILKTKPKSKIDSTRIAIDLERLNRLPGIAKATVTKQLQSNGVYDLLFQIEENFTIIPGIRVNTAPNGDFAFRLSLFEFNALGANHLIGGYYQNEVFSSYGGFIESRYLFTNKLGLGINYQDNNTFENIFFDNETETNYRYQRQSFESYLMYEYDFHNRAELGFEFAADEYTYEDGFINDQLPENLEANKLNLRGQYEYINLLRDYQYFTGWRNQTDVRYETGGDGFLDDNVIITNDLENFTRVGKRGNWATRLRLGYMTNNQTPFSPLIIDNQRNVRGAGNVVDRGSASITLNTEYRHTLLEKGWFVLQSNTFLDLNTQRQINEDFGSAFDSTSFRASPGLGVRFIHKRIFNAVIRLDYGFGIGENAASGLVFGIGQYF
ncbi:POTRA domain-containing protein [Nonlabens ponticola]|uniref:POTRA domain-containing protein n=1 Tax=Nonlabens ponticola TaxID=2496866 RepID=A0A3S9MYZ0_9FLAO|nr:POTRA domain-containing protein [Nonlabens ponticola]AZQ44368.1 hypothetical protein EJ995_08995 [Nonlabens ponticola]